MHASSLKYRHLAFVLAWICLLNVHYAVVAAEQVNATSNWPHWRGPLANGVAPTATPPVQWGPTHNVAWKTAIPGEGSATPIIWNDRVFVLTAVPTERQPEQKVEPHPEDRTTPPNVIYQFMLICIDRSSGEVVWQDVAREQAPIAGRHKTNTYASGSPTTDGRHLYACFGSYGLFCYDLAGHLVWQKHLGQMRTRRGWGEAVTPVVHDDRLIVNWDHEDNSFIVCLDARTGKELWRRPREEKSSWNTPAIATTPEATQVIANGTTRVRSYDLSSGELLWQCGGQTVNPIPSPLVVDDMVICMSGYRGAAAVAIPLTARGDVTDSPLIRWSYDRGTPYVPSPIVYQGQLYFTRTNMGIITSLDAETGELIFGPHRMPGISQLYASPVAAAGRIYWTSRDGHTLVIQAGSEFKVLAENSLDEPIDASPALVDDQVFLRTKSHLVCIQETQSATREERHQ